ncbi:MAG: hypothetical protein Q9M91_06360 [Candidatus Dojkabacteria bacterium]|nr:hypothetical protein [Candidatus Dojkabacteria bacterium]
MIIFIAIFAILILIQLVSGLFALIVRKGLIKTYSFPLSSQIEAATILENYSRVHGKVNLRVHEEIELPAYAMEEFIVINRNKIYLFDLFTNYYLLFQLELTKKKHNKLRDLSTLQNFLFFIELVFLECHLSPQGFKIY